MDKKTKDDFFRSLPYRYRVRAPIFKAIFYLVGAMFIFIVTLEVGTCIEEGLKFLKGFFFK